MTFLRTHWWILVSGFMVVLIAAGCSSEEDDVPLGTLDKTKTELVNFLTDNDYFFNCGALTQSPDDENDLVVLCQDIEFSVFSISLVGREDEIRRVDYVFEIDDADFISEEKKTALKEFNFWMVKNMISLLVFGEQCNDCESWFEYALVEATERREAIRNVMEGIYVSVIPPKEGESIQIIMNARFKNLDFSKSQELYSCERLAEKSIEMTEKDENTITIRKIYNLKHTIEYDLDMGIKRNLRKIGIQMVRDPMRISECSGDAMLESGRDDRGIIVYAEEYMDGDVFVGYVLR